MHGIPEKSAPPIGALLAVGLVWLAAPALQAAGLPEPSNAPGAPDPAVALVNAASSGDLVTVTALVGMRIPVDGAIGKYKLTPLIEAADEGHADVVAYLLEHGADVNLAERRQQSLELPPLEHRPFRGLS